MKWVGPVGKNIFLIEDLGYIEISDGWIRIANSLGSSDIRYEGNFTLKQVSECLRDIVADPISSNGKWMSNWEHGFTIAVEFDDAEDHANLCLSAGYVYITIGLKRSVLPELIQFLFNNHKVQI